MARLSTTLRQEASTSTPQGRTAPPGLYLVRVEHAAGVETGRILRVR